jgi:hypothetical protein
MRPSFNATEGEVINAHCPVVAAHVAALVTAPSNPTHPTNTPTSTSTSKASKKLHLVSLSRPRILQTERDAPFIKQLAQTDR